MNTKQEILKAIAEWPDEVNVTTAVYGKLSAPRKRSRRNTRCDKYWLVVVVDFIDRAQDQEIRIDGFEKIDSTVFEKVIVYKTLFPHVLEAK